MTPYEYKWVPAALVDGAILEECSALYSQHYGTWSRFAPRCQGERIRLSASRIRDLTRSGDARLAQARLNGELVGYAIALQTKVPDWGWVSWVTQFVVHEAHRNRGVGKTLLFSIWGFSTHFAWGLISANPYAIRALEKATRRRCSPSRIARNKRRLATLGKSHVPYIRSDTTVEVDIDRARINTEFFVDHSTLEEKLGRATTKETPWVLGDLPEGWEWLAFTFHDQPQIGLTSEEIQTMLQASDEITRRAYSRMLLGAGQAWARHTDKEVAQIIRFCDLQDTASSILDFGCGIGRHALGLACRGFRVTGVDYIDDLIARARVDAERQGLVAAQFMAGDCRYVTLPEKFDAVICLYDVVGTYADNAENIKILQNIARHLKPGGVALISVMNFSVTAKKARWRFSLSKEPDKLLELPASQTMEKTGHIFDPDYYMIEESSGVIYRKEQFAQGTGLPLEIVVRDRRFRQSEIEEMCRAVGLQITWA